MLKVGDKVLITSDKEDLYNWGISDDSLCGEYALVTKVNKGYTYKLNIGNDYDWPEGLLTVIKDGDRRNYEYVNHPDHYNHGMETIDKMRIMFGDKEVRSFCKLSAFKYIDRAPFKGNQEQDLKKADFYLKYIKKMDEEKAEREYYGR